MSQPNIKRLLELQTLLETFSQIDRVVDRRHNGEYRKENDTEHSYNLAMTAWFLAPHFSTLDRDLLIRLALVHDIVEVHAGDTYVYADESVLATKEIREAAALTKLQEEWKDFPELTASIVDYETRESAEAKFVYALDKIMPIMQIFNITGYTWKREGITPEQLDRAKRQKVSMSPEIAPYYDRLYALLLENRDFFE